MISTAADLVPVEPLQEAFLASGLSGCEVARRIGWERTLSQPTARGGRSYWTVGDSTRLKRALGLRRQGGRGRSCTRRINYDLALRIAEAIGVDPVDVGL